MNKPIQNNSKPQTNKLKEKNIDQILQIEEQRVQNVALESHSREIESNNLKDIASKSIETQGKVLIEENKTKQLIIKYSFYAFVISSAVLSYIAYLGHSDIILTLFKYGVVVIPSFIGGFGFGRLKKS